jgi:hypothetical protein
MRVIDADKLAMISHGDTEDAAYDEGYCSAINWFKEIIDEAPTVEAIPVEWIRHQMHLYASKLQSTELKALNITLCLWEKDQEAR